MKTRTIGQCKDCKYARKEPYLLSTRISCNRKSWQFDMVYPITYGCWYFKERKK